MVFPASVLGAEADYNKAWCSAQPGYIQTEKTVTGGRIDCLTDRYAIEMDYAHKWKECIAQGRWYALQTGKIPGCVLITGPSGGKYVQYLEDYLHGHDMYMKVWTIKE